MKNKHHSDKDTNKKPAEPAANQPPEMTPGAAAPAAEDKTCSIAPEDANVQLKKLQEEIESLRKAASERNEFLNLLQRVQADFVNYQKRAKKDKECYYKYQDEDLLKELLPVLDNFERTLKVQCVSEDAKCIMNGVDLIKREIFRVLEKRGVTRIKTTGAKFDPNLHEALGTVETKDAPEGEIMEELAPGFMLQDRLVRAAKVRIAVKPKTEDNQKPESGKPDTV